MTTDGFIPKIVIRINSNNYIMITIHHQELNTKLESWANNQHGWAEEEEAERGATINWVM